MTSPYLDNPLRTEAEVRFKHTPRPWNYFVGDANGRGLIRIEQHNTGEHIASMLRNEASEANARLIAAAPDLLAALQGLLTHACIADAAPEDVDEEDRALERAARAAIAEATAEP
jgi:hypothetical protein